MPTQQEKVEAEAALRAALRDAVYTLGHETVARIAADVLRRPRYDTALMRSKIGVVRAGEQA